MDLLLLAMVATRAVSRHHLNWLSQLFLQKTGNFSATCFRLLRVTMAAMSVGMATTQQIYLLTDWHFTNFSLMSGIAIYYTDFCTLCPASLQ